MSARAWRAVALQLAFAVALTGVVGLGMGWLSRDFHVLGLLCVATGLSAGAGVAFIATMTGGPWRWPARSAALIAVIAGWTGYQAMEDHHFIELHRAESARLVAVGDALPPELLRDADAVAYLGRNADAELAHTVRQETGFDGPVGRWLYRAGRGVRLIGPMEGGRGLDVGRVGAFVWAGLEILLGALLAALILRRAERRARA